jgi:hypothetical protein
LGDYQPAEARIQYPGLFYCQYADSHENAVFLQRNTDDREAKLLIQKSLAQMRHFPYTSQPFTAIHKSDNFFESGLLFVLCPLVRRRGLRVS